MKPATLQEKVYTPDFENQRALHVWRDMLRDLWSTRELVWRLAHRDLSVGYRQSLLGYLWALLLPLATVALFTYISSTRVLPIGKTPFPYPAYALWSLVLWQLFAGILANTTHSLTAAGSLVTKIDFPKEAIVFGAVGKPMFDFLIKLSLVVLVFLFYDVTFAPALFLIVPLVFLVVLMAVGFGMLLALANLVIRDVANVVSLIIIFGIFMAPVLYPAPVREPFSLLVILNPFSPLLMATQDLIAHGRVQHPLLLLDGGLIALFSFMLGWRIFHVVIRRVTERA